MTLITPNLLVCGKCGGVPHSAPARSTAAFKRSQCLICGGHSYLPATTTWKTLWWILAISSLVGVVAANASLAKGYSWIPGGVGLAAMTLLCIDVGLRRHIDRRRAGYLASVVLQAAPGALPPGDPGRSTPASPWYIAALSLVISASLASGVLGVLVVAGLNNGYSHRVVLQHARPAPADAGYSNLLNLSYSTYPICSGGEDFSGRVSMHIAAYNSVCVGGLFDRARLSASALSTCSELSDFIDDTSARLQECGPGCLTEGDAEGRWGWNYLTPSPVRATDPNDGSLPEVAYAAQCSFELGPLKIGDCPR